MALDEVQAGDAGRTRPRCTTSLVSRMSRPVSRMAFNMPAAVMMAVPCWSS